MQSPFALRYIFLQTIRHIVRSEEFSQRLVMNFGIIRASNLFIQVIYLQINDTGLSGAPVR